MVDSGGVHDSRRVAEPLAVERCRGHVQRLVVEGLGERALLEVAADDRHLVDRCDRRDAQAAQRRDQAAARGVGERQVVDRGGEHVGDLLGDQLLGRGHADVDRVAERTDRSRRLLAERGVCFVADHELVRVTRDLVDVPREPRVGLDRDRVGRSRRGVPGEHGVVEARAVAVLGQLAAELIDEQTAVGEDQDAFGARGLDEPGCGDRLARGGGMPEAVAADRARVGLDRRLLDVLLGLALDLEVELELVVDLVLLVRLVVAVAVLALLCGGDQLGEHSGERVHLMAAELGAGCEMRRLLGQDTFEAEQERVAHLPLGRRCIASCGQLGERVVERAAPRGPGRQDDVRVLVGTQEGLAGPCLGSESVGPDGQRVPRFSRRVRNGFCQCLRHVCTCRLLKGSRPRVQAPFRVAQAQNSRCGGRPSAAAGRA